MGHGFHTVGNCYITRGYIPLSGLQSLEIPTTSPLNPLWNPKSITNYIIRYIEIYWDDYNLNNVIAYKYMKSPWNPQWIPMTSHDILIWIPALRSPSVPGRLGSAEKDTSAAEEENRVGCGSGDPQWCLLVYETMNTIVIPSGKLT